jgi:hypothetical protein
MLDRRVVQEFLEERFEEVKIQIPEEVKIENLTEAFCLYTEDDYYEWLKDNYKSFFDGLDWNRIMEKIQQYKQTYKDNF